MVEAKEAWSVYRLSDGTTLRIKPIMIAVFRAEGMLGGMRLACNRFTGPGRVGLQSMSVVFESSVADQASQTGAQTAEGTALGVIGAIAGGIFGNRG